MTYFFITFAIFVVVMLGMSMGVMLAGKRIKGSCGGLNTISGADKCLVCKQSIDPDSPLRERIHCPRRARQDHQPAAQQPVTFTSQEQLTRK